jgi:phosphoribosyl 1,2-cyclic phosphodiesterase
MRRRLLRSHFSLENVLDFLKANDMSKVQEIHLLHLSDNNSDEVLFRRRVQEATGKPVYIAGR